MTTLVRQIAPVIANAGITQNVSITQAPPTSTGSAYGTASGAYNPITGTTAPVPSTSTTNYGPWIFAGAVIYFLLEGD